MKYKITFFALFVHGYAAIVRYFSPFDGWISRKLFSSEITLYLLIVVVPVTDFIRVTGVTCSIREFIAITIALPVRIASFKERLVKIISF